MKQVKVVTLRPNGNKKRRDISFEPEMVELKRMIRSGELSFSRVSKHLTHTKRN